jgi:hypothetical protein
MAAAALVERPILLHSSSAQEGDARMVSGGWFRLLFVAGAIALGACPADAARIVPQGPVLLWHPGATAGEIGPAKIIRIVPGFRNSDLALLRDDQVIQTPSGRTIKVSSLRAVRRMMLAAATRPRAAPRFAILPAPRGTCTRLPPGTALQSILARPDSDIVCFSSGRRASVAQIRAMAPYALQSHGLPAGAPQTRAPAGAIVVHTAAELTRQMTGALRNAPDSTVLITPQGHQTTLGQLRKLLGDTATQLGRRSPLGGGAQ